MPLEQVQVLFAQIEAIENVINILLGDIKKPEYLAAATTLQTLVDQLKKDSRNKFMEIAEASDETYENDRDDNLSFHENKNN